MSARRPYGAGALYVKAGAWYGRWRTHGRQVNRKLGPVRAPGERDGLTRAMAERELRRRIDTERVPTGAIRLTLAEAVARTIDAAEAGGAKPSTLGTYRSLARVHVVYVGDLDMDRVRAEDVERLIATVRRNGAGPHVVRAVLQLVGMTFRHGVRRGWCSHNPVEGLERRRPAPPAPIRFLDLGELERLFAALGGQDRVIVMTAALAGLRLGELLALTWRDIDWLAGRIRVQRNYTRGRFGTPKSGRGRSMPLASRLATELELHSQRSRFTDDDALVFAHPSTAGPLDGSALRKRFKTALRRAGVRDVRFHDLRHSFATSCAAAGVPPRTLQEWLGHSDLGMVTRYADYAAQPDEADWLERAFQTATKEEDR
jgi:integrase